MSLPTNDLFKSDIIPSVVQVVRTSGALKAQDIGFHKTLDLSVASESTKVSEKIVDLTNQLLETVGESDDHGEAEIDLEDDKELKNSNWKILSRHLDTLFERTDFLFDELKNKQKGGYKNYTYLEESNVVSKDESKNIGKKMEKPQLKFKVPIDNSELNPFLPKLTSKPNALKPYEESLKLVQPEKVDGSDIIDPPYHPHPYAYEIDNQPYPDWILEESEPIKPKNWETTSAEWIDKPEQVDKLVEELSKLESIAVDLEHHDYRTYYGLVSLMQISNREKDWIVDTLALRDDLLKLNVVFTDPKIVKVFHGAFMDIIWLQRDLGLYVVSLFDTYHASKKLGFPKFSLAYLLETFADFKTSKKYQLADWRIRPLSGSMLAYARSDTHFLLYIFDQLKNNLIKKGDNRLQDVLYESRQVAKRRFEYTKFRPLNPGHDPVTCPIMSSNPLEPYLPIVIQYNIPYHIKPVVEVLYNWRDKEARKADESVRYVMSNQALALLATISRPVTSKKVLEVPVFITDFVRKNSDELADIINETLNRLEDNDWQLMDEINKRPSVSEPSNKSNLIQGSSPEMIRLQHQIFNEIYDENSGLLSHVSNQNGVSDNKSRVFGDSEAGIIGVKVGKWNQISVKQVPSRVSYKTKEFEKLYKAAGYESSRIETPNTETVTESERPALEETKNVEETTQAPPPQAPAESKDDIITLRKSKKSKSRNSKRKVQDNDDSAFDYSSAIKQKNNKPTTQPQKKKQKFDPYSKSSAGPKAARGNKQNHSGRSTTFRK